MSLASVSSLSDVVSEIYSAQDRDALNRCVSAGLKRFGFDDFHITINMKDRYDFLMPCMTSYKNHVMNDYDELGFIHFCPLATESLVADGVFCYTNKRRPRDRREGELLEFCCSIDLVGGISIPLPGTSRHGSIAILSSRTTRVYSQNDVDCASIIVKTAVLKAEALGLAAGDAQARLVDAGLSARQAEILNWVTLGKSNGDIATITSLPKRTVEYHIKEIFRKLNVSSRAQAAALVSSGALKA